MTTFVKKQLEWILVGQEPEYKYCWFRHDIQTNVENKEKQEVTEQIFKFMETFTLRILDLENKFTLKTI